MRVNQNNEPAAITRTPSPIVAQSPRLEADQQSFTAAMTLSRALEATPPVRTEKVAQALELIKKETYPPLELIRRISALISPNITGQDQPAK